MNKEELQAFAKESAKSIKTEADLIRFSQMLKKVTVEAALNAELDEHIGFTKHEKVSTGNSRNGFTSKRLQTEDGPFELETPEIATVVLNPNGLKRINAVSPPWTTRFCGSATSQAIKF
jgi:putative transposase